MKVVMRINHFFKTNSFKIKNFVKGFTLAEVMLVLAIIAVVSVATIKIVKAKNDYVNTYMTYSALTNLKLAINGVLDLGYDSDGDGTLEKILPPFGHATPTAVCNLPPTISVSPASSSAGIPYTTATSETSGTFNVTGTRGTGTVTITPQSAPTGGVMTANPSSFTINEGDTQSVSFTATSAANSESLSTLTYEFLVSIAGNSGVHTHVQTRAAAPTSPTPPTPTTPTDLCTEHYGSGMVSAYSGSSFCVATNDTPYSYSGNSEQVSQYWEAAKAACDNLGMRLPSKAELNTLYINRATIGNFTTNIYWSSSSTFLGVWRQNFATGAQSSSSFLGIGVSEFTHKARCVITSPFF